MSAKQFEDVEGVSFPFARGTWYPLTEFLIFEDKLLGARRTDKKLDRALALLGRGWIKVRNDELYPLLFFAQHMEIVEKAQFKICDENEDVDVELKSEDMVRRLQVTTAGPIWGPEDSNWGRGYRLLLEKLKTVGHVSGWGPFRRESDGSISNREEAISSEARNPAYLAGLVRALEGKAHYRIPDCDLIVNAVGYGMAMNETTFLELSHRALGTVPISGFRNVYILDKGEGFFVEERSS
jgi:hypothetical protein